MHNQKRGIVLWLVFVLMLVSLLAASCALWGSPNVELIVENQTEYDLAIFINDFNIGNVSPGEEISDSAFTMNPGKYHIEAKNGQGETVFSKTLTFEQMQKIESRVYKVVIKPPQNK